MSAKPLATIGYEGQTLKRARSPMFRLTLCFVTLLSLTARPVYGATCSTQGQVSAPALNTSDPEIGAELSVSLGIWLSALQGRGFEARLASATTGCERKAFNVASTTYVLRGENDALPTRVATPASKDAETGYLVAIPNLEASLQGPSANPLSGYALMTTRGGLHTAWRVYGDIPLDGVLVKDLSDALSGRLRPFMQWRDGRVSIIVGKSGPAGDKR